MSFLSKMIDRIFVVFAALAFSQIPLFYSQYLHQLEGHRGELFYQYNLLEQTARSSGKSVGAWIAKFLSNADSDLRLQGEFLQALTQRLALLTEAVEKLAHASLFEKPFLLVRYLDQAIAKSTWEKFQPGISFTIEGACYVLVGILFGYVLFKALAWCLRKTLPRPKAWGSGGGASF
jgi:hypothetical protein